MVSNTAQTHYASASRDNRALTLSVVDGGFQTSASAALLTDANKAWTPDTLTGAQIFILSGAAKGDRRVIIANAATILTPDSNFSAIVAGGDIYAIIQGLGSSASIPILASEADTVATRTSSNQTAPNAKGIILRLNTVNKTGTNATYMPKIQAIQANGDAVDYWVAAAAVTNAEDNIYILYPGASDAGADVTEIVGLPLPFVWRVVLTVASADGSHNMDTLFDAQILT